MTHQFLSDEWIDAVHAIKVAHEGTPIDREGLTVNATITGAPFGNGTIELHSARGPVIGFAPGHVDDADVSIELDYALARELILDRSLDLLEQAVLADRIVISGDRAAFRDWWGTRIGNPDAVRLDDEIRDITS